jgi:glutamine amidotransferase
MQLMAKKSFEHGETCGLGWFDAEVIKINPPSNGRVPHMGWNTITFDQSNPILHGLPDESAVYFVHSYWMQCANKSDVAATCDYGQPLTAAIAKGNLFATQFHPEKSQEVGLQILRNFLTWKP